jgi:pyruvate,orthophosphate dikinase
MQWADKFRKLEVRTNSDTPADAARACELGAEGIGLCRTEHMFFEGNRIEAFREMICANTVEEREAALAKILPMQQGDFEQLFETLEGKPVTIRLLDPPLHEFVPTEEKDIEALAKAQNKDVETIRAIIQGLHETNPMLGHRGCRLGVTYPEITAMQARAIVEAALAVKGSHPEIMIPLVGNLTEFRNQRAVIMDTVEEIKKEKKLKSLPLAIKIGTMIEVPRAALTADEVAKEAEFFSFGTNDLTQMTCGFSRDDAGMFINDYIKLGLYEYDPFQTLDQEGVGRLIKQAAQLGRSTRKDIKLGICGEHGGDPRSIEFCHNAGLNYVSCSPYRVPIARLAAAQAVLKKK